MHFHTAVNVPLRVPPSDVLALVVILLAARQSDLHLCQPVLVYVHLERHDRQAFERRLPDELADLLLMQQQLAVTKRVSIKAIALLVRADIHTVKHHLTVLDARVTLFDADLALTDGLNFRSRKDDARLVGLLDKIIVVSFFIVCN